GITWVEANSYGLPVIGYEIAGLHTVDESCALMVEPGDHVALAAGLERVLTDASFRDALAEGGRQNARRFSWARTSDEVLAFAMTATGLQQQDEAPVAQLPSTLSLSNS
ncbi:MAG: glycosyltransferase, partial [Bacteroidota bacterium]